MKKHLPLDDFEREVQRLADGFEIQPRAMVFEQIRSEFAAETQAPGKGKILKGIFSKSLNFISYAAAASVATVGSVLVYQQQESVQQQERVLSSYHKVQSNQSQTLTQRLSDTISTQVYETAANKPASGENTENMVSSNDQPVTLFEVEPSATVVNEQERNNQPQNKVVHTGSAPRLSKQVKSEENHVTAITTVNTKQPTSGKTIATVAQESITTTNSTGTTIQQSKTPEQSQQSVVTEFVQVSNSSLEHVVVQEQPATIVGQDSALANLVADSAVNIASIADTAVKDTTGIKRTLAARNWIKKGVWSVAAFYNLESNRRDLYVPVSSDPGYYYESYKSFMNKTSQQGSSFATGVKVEYNFLNHWGLSSGFTYAERREYLSVDKYHELVYNLASAGWEINTVTTAGYSQQIRNTFTYLELPAMVHYTNTIAGRFAFRLSAGLSYSYLMKQSASYIDMTDRSVMMGPAPVYHHSTRISESPFRQHNLNLQLGATVSYLVASRMEVFAGPSFRRSLLSTYSSGYPFRQRFNATGGETGIRYYF